MYISAIASEQSNPSHRNKSAYFEWRVLRDSGDMTTFTATQWFHNILHRFFHNILFAVVSTLSQLKQCQKENEENISKKHEYRAMLWRFVCCVLMKPSGTCLWNVRQRSEDTRIYISNNSNQCQTKWHNITCDMLVISIEIYIKTMFKKTSTG